MIALLTAVIVPWLILRSRRDRRLHNFTGQLPIAAELMSNALRAGLSLQGAIELVAREIGDPAREEFGLVVREVRLGGSLADALEALEHRMPSTDLEVMVTALLVQRVAGGNLIKSMGALSQTLIERQRTHGRNQDHDGRAEVHQLPHAGVIDPRARHPQPCRTAFSRCTVPYLCRLGCL